MSLHTPTAPALDADADFDAGDDALRDAPGKRVEDYLGEGFAVDDVKTLQQTEGARVFFPLLRSLLMGGEDDLWVRLAIVGDLLSDEESSWTPEQLANRFRWVAREERIDAFRRLSRGGWLTYMEGRYRLTAHGEAMAKLLSYLPELAAKAGDVGFAVEALRMAHHLGHEVGTHLDQLFHLLKKTSEEVEDAYESRSEVRILEAQRLLVSSLARSESARQTLDEVDIQTPEGHAKVRACHAVLSSLHQWVSALQRALVDIGRRRVSLGESGLTMRDVTNFLMRADVSTLAALADGVLGLPPTPTFIVLDNVLAEAEYELYVREIVPDDERRGWTQAAASIADEPPTSRADDHVARFSDALKRIGAGGAPCRVEDLVIGDTWSEAAYRMAMLSMLDTTEVQEMLDSPPLDVEFDPNERVKPTSGPVAELTGGWVRPRAATRSR